MEEMFVDGCRLANVRSYSVPGLLTLLIQAVIIVTSAES